MSIDHFKYMALARDAEQQSMHPAHKVGALICGTDRNTEHYEIAKSNFWPALLDKHIGKDKKLGNASTTVHAEVAAICAAPATENATIYVTDLPCPNCAKVMAEARIKNIYTDALTHDTPLGQKMKPYFDEVSTPILKNAGISVYEINSEAKTIAQIIIPAPNSLLRIHRPIRHTPLEHSDINQATFINMIEKQKTNTSFAACYAKSTLGQYNFLLAQPQRSVGLLQEQADEISNHQNKYEPTLQPINRLLLTCARYGLKIDEDYLYSSQTPTSREFVNMIGAGYTSLCIGDRDKCRDDWGLKALVQLKTHKIIDLKQAKVSD
ncbi:MAG: hypothetical protein COB36_02030 [Alphaproteobacteria bacterium]|nr:MAG: hypothetical protein COB36_02030 [Alphaproteobacteria bacterium]